MKAALLLLALASPTFASAAMAAPKNAAKSPASKKVFTIDWPHHFGLHKKPESPFTPGAALYGIRYASRFIGHSLPTPLSPADAEVQAIADGYCNRDGQDCALTGVLRNPGNPARFSIYTIDGEDFELRNQAEDGPDGEALNNWLDGIVRDGADGKTLRVILYVHGFRNMTESAVKALNTWHAPLAEEAKAAGWGDKYALVALSWPSFSENWWGTFGYFGDSRNSYNYSPALMEKVVRPLQKRAGGRKLDLRIIAHSMGANFVGAAYRYHAPDNNPEVASRIVLLSGDVRSKDAYRYRWRPGLSILLDFPTAGFTRLQETASSPARMVRGERLFIKRRGTGPLDVAMQHSNEFYNLKNTVDKAILMSSVVRGEAPNVSGVTSLVFFPVRLVSGNVGGGRIALEGVKERVKELDENPQPGLGPVPPRPSTHRDFNTTPMYALEEGMKVIGEESAENVAGGVVKTGGRMFSNVVGIFARSHNWYMVQPKHPTPKVRPANAIMSGPELVAHKVVSPKAGKVSGKLRVYGSLE